MRKFMILLAGMAIFAAGPLLAQEFHEGQHFQRIDGPDVASDHVEVIDAFGYPCPACRRFLPHFDAWIDRQPDYVKVEHMPIALQQGWDLFALAYYTARVMGIAEESHEAMFRAVHDERRQFRNFDDIAKFYSDYGVDKDSFINTSQSFAVDAAMRQNRNSVRSYGIRSTPSVIVQGKWLVSVGAFSSYDEMLEAVDYLVAREAEKLGLGEADESAAESALQTDDEAVEEAAS